ncbi:hypothetical protein MTO96_033629 [Rhipicephalus appendiculatus]
MESLQTGDEDGTRQDSLKMASSGATLGKLLEFNPDTGDFEVYLERLRVLHRHQRHWRRKETASLLDYDCRKSLQDAQELASSKDAHQSDIPGCR